MAFSRCIPRIYLKYDGRDYHWELLCIEQAMHFKTAEFRLADEWFEDPWRQLNGANLEAVECQKRWDPIDHWSRLTSYDRNIFTRSSRTAFIYLRCRWLVIFVNLRGMKSQERTLKVHASWLHILPMYWQLVQFISPRNDLILLSLSYLLCWWIQTTYKLHRSSNTIAVLKSSPRKAQFIF